MKDKTTLKLPPVSPQDAPTQAPRWRSVLWLVVRVLFVVLIFAFVLRSANIDLPTLQEEARQIQWGYVLASLGVWVLSLYVASGRWWVLLNVVRSGTSIHALFVFNLVGIFYAQFLPGLVSGDVVKGYYLAREGDEKIKVMSSALVDRILGITVNGLLGVGALVASPLVMQMFDLNRFIALIVFGGVLVGLLIGYAIIRLLERYANRFPAPLKAVYEPLRLYAAHPLALGGAALLSVGYFVLWALALWLLAAAVGMADLGFFAMLLVLAVVNVAQFLPLTINGAGIREGAVLAVLTVYAVPEAKALVFALLIPLTVLALAALGGLFVLLDYRVKRAPSEAPHA